MTIQQAAIQKLTATIAEKTELAKSDPDRFGDAQRRNYEVALETASMIESETWWAKRKRLLDGSATDLMVDLVEWRRKNGGTDAGARW